MTEPQLRDTGRTDAARWIRDHETALWRYLRYLGCPHDRTPDLLQDAFLAGLSHGVAGQTRERAAAWLRTTARNLYFMELRAARSRPAMRSLERLDAEWHESTTAREDAFSDALVTCVERLEARSREAIDLRYRDGASRGEIATRLGLSEAGVKALLRRVRDWLRNCVEATRNGDER